MCMIYDTKSREEKPPEFVWGFFLTSNKKKGGKMPSVTGDTYHQHQNWLLADMSVNILICSEKLSESPVRN